MPPTPKAVLICLADYANDQGDCWPSIDTIAQFTCFGRTAVIGAIQWLIENRAITKRKSDGRSNAYVVHPELYVGAKTGDYHYLYRITHKPTGAFYVGLRSCVVRPEDDDYWGSGKACDWLDSVRDECVREVLAVHETRELAAIEESKLIAESMANPLCLNKRASSPNQAKGPSGEWSASRTVRKADGTAGAHTSPAGGLQQFASRTPEVRQADSNHQEPSLSPKKATTKRVVAIELPAWLPKSAWRDWCDHRKAIKSPMTPKAAELSIAKLAEYREQGFPPERVIDNAIERGWRGLYPPTGQGPPAPAKPSAAADFRGKTYEPTPIADLPPDLRAAAERALRDDD